MLIYRVPQYVLVNDTRRVVDSSIVKINSLSYRCCFIIIFVILKKRRYIFCYCILGYDGNLILDLNVPYVSFLIIFLTIFESVKEVYKERCPIFDQKHHWKEQDKNN